MTRFREWVALGIVAAFLAVHPALAGDGDNATPQWQQVVGDTFLNGATREISANAMRRVLEDKFPEIADKVPDKEIEALLTRLAGRRDNSDPEKEPADAGPADPGPAAPGRRERPDVGNGPGGHPPAEDAYQQTTQRPTGESLPADARLSRGAGTGEAPPGWEIPATGAQPGVLAAQGQTGRTAQRPATVLDAKEGASSEDLLTGSSTRDHGAVDWTPSLELPRSAPVIPTLRAVAAPTTPPPIDQVRAALADQVRLGNLTERQAGRLLEQLGPIADRLEDLEGDPSKLRDTLGPKFKDLLAEEESARPVGAPDRIVAEGGNAIAQARNGDVNVRVTVPSAGAGGKAEGPVAAAGEKPSAPPTVLLYSPPSAGPASGPATLDARLGPFASVFPNLGKTPVVAKRDRAAGPIYGKAVDVATGEARRADGPFRVKPSASGQTITLRSKRSTIGGLIARLTSWFRGKPAGEEAGVEIADAGEPGSGLKPPSPGEVKPSRALASLAPRQALAASEAEEGWFSWSLSGGLAAAFFSLIGVAFFQWRRQRIGGAS